MGFINLAEKTIQAKLVYYGVGMGGKTTSLQAVHGIMCPRNEVQLVSINTEEDATLLFDFLPINLGLVEGFKIKIQGFTVPGQPKYRLMRKYVLSGADAVVFVVDSDRSRLGENKVAWDGLMENLRQNGIQPSNIPLVVQYNKRDLDDILTEEELDREFLVRDDMTSFPSVATLGQGVYEAFVHASACLVEAKVRQYGLGRGDIDAEAVAAAARDKLWDLRVDQRDRDVFSERGPTQEVTVLDDGVVAPGDTDPEPAADDTLATVYPELSMPPTADDDDDSGSDGEDAETGEDGADDHGLEYELRDELTPGATPRLSGVVLTDDDLDVDLSVPDADNLDGATAEGAVHTDDDDDGEEDALLDKTVQSNVELVSRYGELDQYRALLERRIDDLVAVAQNTVHDLNRPLSAIKLMLGSLAKGYMGELQSKALEAVENGLCAARQMERLIGDLLDSSRLDHDGMKMVFEPIDMNELLGQVVQRLHYELDEVGAQVLVDELPVIQGDAWALTKAFTNVLGNAVQYSHPERSPMIQVAAVEEDDRIVFSITDNGIGIPERDRDRLFRRFERGSNTGGVSGTGLGLHIIREVVLGHGGSVWIESEEGLGTVFFLGVPREPVQPPHSQVSEVAARADL